MKRWQEKLPTLNLILIILIIITILFTSFVLGPVKQISIKNDEILNKLYSRYTIDSCRDFKSYFIEKEMYVVNCVIETKEFYFFMDKNGIIYNKMLVDNEKEQLDFMMLVDRYALIKPEIKVIYYMNKHAYWIKTTNYEYVIDYDNYEVLMKVRF